MNDKPKTPEEVLKLIHELDATIKKETDTAKAIGCLVMFIIFLSGFAGAVVLIKFL